MAKYIRITAQQGLTHIPEENVIQDPLLNSYKFPIEKDVAWLDKKFPKLPTQITKSYLQRFQREVEFISLEPVEEL